MTKDKNKTSTFTSGQKNTTSTYTSGQTSNTSTATSGRKTSPLVYPSGKKVQLSKDGAPIEGSGKTTRPVDTGPNVEIQMVPRVSMVTEPIKKKQPHPPDSPEQCADIREEDIRGEDDELDRAFDDEEHEHQQDRIRREEEKDGNYMDAKSDPEIVSFVTRHDGTTLVGELFMYKWVHGEDTGSLKGVRDAPKNNKKVEAKVNDKLAGMHGIIADLLQIFQDLANRFLPFARTQEPHHGLIRADQVMVKPLRGVMGRSALEIVSDAYHTTDESPVYTWLARWT